MGKTAKTIALFTVIIAISSTSCKKKETTAPEENPPVVEQSPANTGNKVEALLNNLATPLQSYTVDASTYNTFTCANGTRIITYPNSFLTPTGLPATGVINIQVKDILSKKDMILNNAIPVSNGQLLVSGGEVYINATQGGQKLKKNPAGSLTFMVPAGTNPSSQMQAFYATGGANLSATNLNWLTATNTGTATAYMSIAQDSSGGPSYYYNFPSDSVSWTNCDYFYLSPGAKTTCTVTLTGNANNSNAMVFLSKNGTSIVARLYSEQYTTISQNFESYANSIPLGDVYTVGAICFDGTNYFYTSQQVTMTVDMVIMLPTLTQTTQSQILTNLSALQ